MYSPEEEIAHSITHFLSAIITVFSTIFIVFSTELLFNQIFPLYVMGFSASWAFFASCAYHLSKLQPFKERNRLVDKASIYVMISGSGTCFTLMGNTSSLAVLSCLSILLITSLLILNFCLNNKTTETFTVVSYVLLGWLATMPAFGIIEYNDLSSFSHIWFLIAGGFAYSVGLVFYIKPQKWFHTAWHICTMIGFGFHFIGAYLFLEKISIPIL